MTSHWHYYWPYYDISYPIYSHDYFQTTVTTIILIVVLHTTDTSTFLQTALHSKSTNNTFLQTSGTTTGLTTTLHTKSTRKTFYKPKALLLSCITYQKHSQDIKTLPLLDFFLLHYKPGPLTKLKKKTLALLHSVLLHYEPHTISRLFTNYCHGYCPYYGITYQIYTNDLLQTTSILTRHFSVTADLRICKM